MAERDLQNIYGIEDGQRFFQISYNCPGEICPPLLSNILAASPANAIKNANDIPQQCPHGQRTVSVEE